MWRISHEKARREPGVIRSTGARRPYTGIQDLPDPGEGCRKGQAAPHKHMTDPARTHRAKAPNAAGCSYGNLVARERSNPDLCG